MNMKSALAFGPAPRAVVRAMAQPEPPTDPVDLIRQIAEAQREGQSKTNARIAAIEASVDEVFARDAGLRLGGFGNGERVEDPAYTATFAAYIRNGDGIDDLRKANAQGLRANIHAAMSVGTPSDGGYLAPVEWDRQIRKAQQQISPMRRLAQVITTGVGAFSTVWSDNAWGSGWVGETAARPETSSPSLTSLEFASGEIYANVAITQRLLDDAALDLEAWLAGEVSDEFSKQEGVAFLSGNGTNKPFGLLTYITGGAADGRHPGGNLTVDQTAASGTLTGDDLVTFSYALKAPYRQGATWLMNSGTAAAIAKLKDTTGAYVWREGLMAGEPATLLGYPVEIDEGMPAIAASALAVAFGNFKQGYLINDRMGVRTLRDPYTNKPYVNFYSTKRVGGGLLDPSAIRLLKIKP